MLYNQLDLLSPKIGVDNKKVEKKITTYIEYTAIRLLDMYIHIYRKSFSLIISSSSAIFGNKTSTFRRDKKRGDNFPSKKRPKFLKHQRLLFQAKKNK